MARAPCSDAAHQNAQSRQAIDFDFPELPAWQHAKALSAADGLGRLRHVVVTWNTENQAVRLRLAELEDTRHDGGGVLANFVSHCFHYLEWFCGPIAGLAGRLFRLAAQRDASRRGAGARFCVGRRRQPADELRLISWIWPPHRILWR